MKDVPKITITSGVQNAGHVRVYKCEDSEDLEEELNTQLNRGDVVDVRITDSEYGFTLVCFIARKQILERSVDFIETFQRFMNVLSKHS